MTAIKNGQILQYCHFNKIIKGSRTSFLSIALSQSHVRNVSHISQKDKNLGNLRTKALFLLQIKKIINYTSMAAVWQKLVL